ncbi:MAG: O-antigen ligase family protein [Alphaproteobacteria bacterium]
MEFPLFDFGFVTLTSSEILIGLLLAAGLFVLGRSQLKLDLIGWGLLAVLASMLLTTLVVTGWRLPGMKFCVRFAGGIGLYLVLRGLFEKQRLALAVVRTLAMTALVFSLIGVVQHYFPGVLDPLLSLIVPNKFAPFDPSAPLAFTTGIFHDGDGFVVRASAVFGYCNTFSYFLVVALGAAALVLLVDRDRTWRQIAALSLPLNLWALWLTYSRGAWLALAGGLLTCMAVWLRKGRAQSNIKLLVGMGTTVLVVVVVLASLWIRGTEPIEVETEEAQTPAMIAHGAYELDTVQTRLQLWRAAWSLWRENPIFGAGVDRFRFAYYDHLSKPNYDLVAGQGLYQPHNIFLTALAWQGALGLLTLFFCLSAIGLTAWRRWQREGNGALAVVLALLAVVGMANLYDAMMFDSYPHMLLVTMILALLAAEGWRHE